MDFPVSYTHINLTKYNLRWHVCVCLCLFGTVPEESYRFLDKRRKVAERNELEMGMEKI